MQTREQKIQYLKDVSAGKIKIEDNPLNTLDFNNISCSTVEDFGHLKKCLDYVRDHSYPQEKADILFEGLVKAGTSIGLVDAETESTWRSMRKQSGKIYMLPIKASKIQQYINREDEE